MLVIHQWGEQIEAKGLAPEHFSVEAVALDNPAPPLLSGAREKYETWVGEFAAALKQSDDGMYVNFLNDQGLKEFGPRIPERRGTA